MITIRSAEVADIPAVYAMVKELAIFQKAEQKLTNTVEQMQNDFGLFHCLMAENHNKELVGIATYFFGYYTWSGKTLYLDDLYVKPGQRGQNAGTLLLKVFFTTALQQNCKRIRWQVSDWNLSAIEFYKKLGAALDKELFNCDFELPAMEKALQALG